MSDTTNLKSQSILQPTKFQLSFKRMPSVQYFCQRVILPGAEIKPLQQKTPFKNKMLAGNKIEYTSFDISFLLEEEMISWEEILNWMKDLGIEEGYPTFNKLKQLPDAAISTKPQYSDATLIVLSTKNNPIIKFTFFDCFPITLSPIVFDTASTPSDSIRIDASFGFFYYNMERITN